MVTVIIDQYTPRFCFEIWYRYESVNVRNVILDNGRYFRCWFLYIILHGGGQKCELCLPEFTTCFRNHILHRVKEPRFAKRFIGWDCKYRKQELLAFVTLAMHESAIFEVDSDLTSEVLFITVEARLRIGLQGFTSQWTHKTLILSKQGSSSCIHALLWLKKLYI